MRIKKFSLIAAALLGSSSLLQAQVQKIEGHVKLPADLEYTEFANNTKAPCPACLTVAPTGEVFVGVDQNGSLGKNPDKGKIIRLIDKDNDGVADEQTLFCKVDNPRGMIWANNKLWVLHPPHLSVYTDADNDGVADSEPTRLITNISVPKHNKARGADHTTNGIQLGIDGWIYIAVGDFGFTKAKAIDGREMTMLGGGIVRVRPDGTEMEVYTHGLRNIYDVAVDPKLNIFTRGNTNDGGGWNMRFIHNVQSGEYGYPILFKRFTEEIIPALVDVGGGSGTGAEFFQEPSWPEKYNNTPMMCDWGRNQLYIHRVKPDGASFTQTEERFIHVSKITDMDVDGSGRMYIGSWIGNGFSGGPNGFVVRVTPKDWQYEAFPDLQKLSAKDLAASMKSASYTKRLYTQQEFLRRKETGQTNDASVILTVAQDKSVSLDARITAIFTYKQYLGAKATAELVKLAADPQVSEWVLRAAADIKSQNESVPVAPFAKALSDTNPRVQVAAAVALGRLGKKEGAEALLAKVAMKADEFRVGEVKEDYEAIFKSKQVTKSKVEKISVPIKGLKKLYLVVEGGKDGTGHDHAAWFEPTLVKGNTRTKLTDIKWKKVTSGWKKAVVNQSVAGGALKAKGGQKFTFGIGTHSRSVISYELDGTYDKFEATGGIASTSNKGTVTFEVWADEPYDKNKIEEGPHATPNSSVMLSHVASKSLTDLGEVSPLLAALDKDSKHLSLRAMRKMHNPQLVEGLIKKLGNADLEMKKRILAVLIRLYNKEKFYDGSWWWGTRPDTRGPYYYTETWEASAAIKTAVQSAMSNPELKDFVTYTLEYNRVDFDNKSAKAETKVKSSGVDLKKIMAKKGQIGKMAVEDVIIALGKIKGDAKKGLSIYNRSGCVACHSINAGDPLKGPHLGQIGAILDRSQMAMAILKPNDTISQGFATHMITTKEGQVYQGFISKERPEGIELRNITGQIFEIPAAKIKDRKELHTSMMPPGLVNGLSLEEFASLISFLQGKKK
ncbi:MAG: NPCBM/NEW2 domain-containing protein [Lentisphaeraceae bacterium]|nr:NPCBM/NEW2 domain-containing protein [Lentisphaeraceae bacterium]